MTVQQLWVAFITLVIKELKRLNRLWYQAILPPAITALLYFVIFGRVIGSRIGNIYGHSYIDFIVPGLIMLSVISSAYGSTSFSIFSAKFQRNIEELMVSPMPNWLIVVGALSSGVIRGFVVATVIAFIAADFGDFHIHSFFVLLVVLFLTSVMFSLAGVINGVLANKFDEVSIVPTFLLTPLTYLGGVFYSIQSLPSPWNHLSMFNPIAYIVNNFRYGYIGHASLSLSLGYSILIGCVIVLFIVALWAVNTNYGLRR